MKFQTKSQIAAVCWVVLSALRDAKTGTLGGVPNGYLYAQLMGTLDLEQWNGIITLLKAGGHLTETNYLLKITPKGEEFWKLLDTIYTAKQEAK